MRSLMRLKMSRRVLVAVAALAVPLAGLAAAAPALAANPYEKYFSQCPASDAGGEIVSVRGSDER